jgi:hypothetical protein
LTVTTGTISAEVNGSLKATSDIAVSPQGLAIECRGKAWSLLCRVAGGEPALDPKQLATYSYRFFDPKLPVISDRPRAAK